MAEIAASIIGISTFGIKLTLTLYEFGSTVSTARQQTDHIAKHVTLYSNVLELLAERLEADAPIISDAAIDLVEELYDQSDELFSRIRSLLPRKDKGEELSFRQKIAWNFKKTKVDLLVGELEYLKSTVQLLVAVIFTGRRVRSYRKRRKEIGEENCAPDRDILERQCLKAQTVIVEQSQAAEELPLLQEADNRSDALALEGPSASNDEGTNTLERLPHQTDVITTFQRSLSLIGDSNDRRTHLLEHSTDLLHDLLVKWTNVDVQSSHEIGQSADKDPKQLDPTPPTQAHSSTGPTNLVTSAPSTVPLDHVSTSVPGPQQSAGHTQMSSWATNHQGIGSEAPRQAGQKVRQDQFFSSDFLESLIPEDDDSLRKHREPNPGNPLPAAKAYSKALGPHYQENRQGLNPGEHSNPPPLNSGSRPGPGDGYVAPTKYATNDATKAFLSLDQESRSLCLLPPLPLMFFLETQPGRSKAARERSSRRINRLLRPFDMRDDNWLASGPHRWTHKRCPVTLTEIDTDISVKSDVVIAYHTLHFWSCITVELYTGGSEQWQFPSQQKLTVASNGAETWSSPDRFIRTDGRGAITTLEMAREDGVLRRYQPEKPFIDVFGNYVSGEKLISNYTFLALLPSFWSQIPEKSLEKLPDNIDKRRDEVWSMSSLSEGKGKFQSTAE